jgi:NADH-quinone oxidoreductase subunit L
MDISDLPTLLAAAWLTPLASFVVIVLFGKSLGPHGKFAGYLSVGAIVTSAILSFTAMFGVWLPNHPLADASHHGEQYEEGDHPDGDDAEHDEADDHTAAIKATGSAGGHESVITRDDIHPQSGWISSEDGKVIDLLTLVAFQPANDDGGSNTVEEQHAANPPPTYHTGDWYTLGQFGKLKLTIGYYIDALTVTMFCMVTLIASCVHIYAVGYMHDELHDPYVDHEVHSSHGGHLHRPGRFHRFFQYLSLFSFSMLGIVIAGNVAMVFVFWELVGICSYFLIGFYFERHSASTAANKAFIVNRVGDFGMLVGMMALWSTLGTFNFGDIASADGQKDPGIFSQLRSRENGYQLVPPQSMIAEEARNGSPFIDNATEDEGKAGQWLLLIAGVGIFCGCVGKSAQFPLHTWLPDAMEGPTPVSALVHSATMVAAGVYLVGRCYPIFSPEALLVIAVIGCITLFLAATIAVTAVDIKRVLAYSTVSQLGFMMLALGLGGWVAGLFHLITHAFFKGLLFLCSGSVIHAVHTNDMRLMGGLRHKMPITAYTMLIGCLAIAGIGIPFMFGFSGFHSKDLIVEQALHYARTNRQWGYAWIFVVLPLAGAALTSFYMFRLWYMTFAGKPRDHHRYDHAHESPWVMAGPLVLLAIFATGVGWPLSSAFPGVLSNLGVEALLEQGRPVGMLGDKHGALLPDLIIPDEHASHADEVRIPAGWSAILVAIVGIAGATVVYLWELINAETLRRSLRVVYQATWNKWWFDELYQAVFVAPTMLLARKIAAFDRSVIDGVIHACAAIGKIISKVFDAVFDRTVVDGSVNTFASWTWDFGLLLRRLQTGNLRQYVLFIVMGTWFMCLAYFAVSFVLLS